MSSLTPLSMQRSWLNDVSPPSSICTSLDFQNCGNMLNSLITSSDFTNVSFLLDGNDSNEVISKNGTIPIENVSPSRGLTKNLMDFTFNVNNTIVVPSNSTFTADPKKQSIEKEDQLSDSIGDFDKNLTFNAYSSSGKNLTWNKFREPEAVSNSTIIQSTPVQNHNEGGISRKSFDHTLSPISSLRADDDDEGDDNVVIRNIKSRNIANAISADDYRNSMEDQCEFILNEETIKLSSRVCGDSFENLDLKTAFIESTDSNEKEFDKILDSFDIKKSMECFNMKKSVDNIKQRHSLINLEKQREEKQRKDEEYDNKAQYDSMNKSSERLLRRSRVFDDVNLQLQRQKIEDSPVSADPNDQDCDHEIVDKGNRDRFKTIKLNKKLQSGMVVVDIDQEPLRDDDAKSTSPGTNKERRNQMNLQKQDMEDADFKKPVPVASKLSKFGFSRPTYSSRNNLNLPLKASSTDSLDNDESALNHVGAIKSPMGIKSKSIHNLMYNGNSASQQGYRMGSYGNLKLGATQSQSNLKAPRASSLVRPAERGYKVR